eukprot:gene7390-10070_t
MLKRGNKRNSTGAVLNSDTYQTNNESLSISSPRSGKWTADEEKFANRLIVEFETGTLLDCEDGCTLRSYLARRLNCAPMRISKKFAGKCIGKHVFIKRPASSFDNKENQSVAVLQELENKFHSSYNSISNSSDDSNRFVRVKHNKPVSTLSDSSSNSDLKDDSLCNSSDDDHSNCNSGDSGSSLNISEVYDAFFPQHYSQHTKKLRTRSIGEDCDNELGYVTNFFGYDIEEDAAMLRVKSSNDLVNFNENGNIEADDWRMFLSTFDSDNGENQYNSEICRNDHSFTISLSSFN